MEGSGGITTYEVVANAPDETLESVWQRLCKAAAERRNASSSSGVNTRVELFYARPRTTAGGAALVNDGEEAVLIEIAISRQNTNLPTQPILGMILAINEELPTQKLLTVLDFDRKSGFITFTIFE